MRAFEIPAGTKVYTGTSPEIVESRIFSHTPGYLTKKPLMFFLEDIVVDATIPSFRGNQSISNRQVFMDEDLMLFSRQFEDGKTWYVAVKPKDIVLL